MTTRLEPSSIKLPPYYEIAIREVPASLTHLYKTVSPSWFRRKGLRSSEKFLRPPLLKHTRAKFYQSRALLSHTLTSFHRGILPCPVPPYLAVPTHLYKSRHIAPTLNTAQNNNADHQTSYSVPCVSTTNQAFSIPKLRTYGIPFLFLACLSASDR